MLENNSVYNNSAAEDNKTHSDYGIQNTDATLPDSSKDKSTNIESSDTIESQRFKNKDSTDLKRGSLHITEVPPKRTSIKTSAQTAEAPDNQNSKKSDRNDKKLPDLVPLLKFGEQLFTSQLHLFFIGTLVFVAILINQAPEGIRVKLDLEVSPPSNPVERIHRK